MKHLTISSYHAGEGHDLEGYPIRHVPYLRMRGDWLRRAGFEVGDRVRVSVEQGTLTVTRTPQEKI